MLYALAKAAHLISLFVWIGGMVAVALSLRHPTLALMKPLKTYDRVVTTPAMVSAWGFGILLATHGGWFSDIWLWAKLALVLLFSGLHGALTGRLRRSIREIGQETGPSSERVSDARSKLLLPLGFILLAVIVVLVTTKPF